jgi:hypothetical protein
MAVVLALIALDLFDQTFNSWFDHHSFSTDVVSTLLGLAVTVLVIDRVADRRWLRERSRVMAAQAAIVAGQALRASKALKDALDGTGERDAAGDELRTFMELMLTAAPVLIDAPQTRQFLEESQHLGAEIARALAETRSGEHPAELDKRLSNAADRVRDAAMPLLAMLNLDQQSAIWGPMFDPGDDTPADGPATVKAPADPAPDESPTG